MSTPRNRYRILSAIVIISIVHAVKRRPKNTASVLSTYMLPANERCHRPMAIRNGRSHCQRWPSQRHASTINYIFVPIISHIYIFLHCYLPIRLVSIYFFFGCLPVLSCQSYVCFILRTVKRCDTCECRVFEYTFHPAHNNRNGRNGKHFSGCLRFIN